MAGSRGPHAETVIPPNPNAIVTAHRQRTSVERSVPAMAAVTGTLPPAPAEPTLAGHHFRSGGPLTADVGLTKTTRSASPQKPSRSLRLSGRVAQETILAEPVAPEYLAMVARYLDSAGHEIVAYNVASVNDDPAVAPSRVRHAPNTVGNFCFEVTLGYRRVERGR
jgi:hypothetical protein